jgi:phosphoglycerol transferase MdoB-like AlkP superfamily enzyme
MRAASLLVVLILAKVLVLAGRSIGWSWWAPLAYFWQDVLVVLLFALANVLTRRRPWIGWAVYTVLVLYTAVNVPVAHVLSTPLTWMLLRAARGPLADSILYYVTVPNLLRMGVVLAAAVLVPVGLGRLGARFSSRVSLLAVAAGLVVTALGPLATQHVDTLGLYRNAVVALVSTALPRLQAAEFAGEWRISPFGSRRGEDLTYYRGAARGRNVVVIHLESTGARYLRPYGAAEDPMPYLTKLANQAILFENAYTVYPETIRSFFAVQCSVYPALDTPPEVYEPALAPGFAALLARQGYRTGLVHSGRFGYLGMDAVLRNRGYQTLEDAGAIGGEHESSFGIDEPSTVRRILQWIDATPPGQRFLVTYLPIAGHHPYAAPGGPFPHEREIDRYRNALHASDEALRRLLDGLRRRGLDRETLFILFGDHAEAFGQHEGNTGHTCFLYEENVRVPYLVAAPGLFRRPIRVRRVASLIDTAPTILDLLGLPRPAAYQGRSLLDGQEAVALFCTDYSQLLAGLRDGRWKLIHELDTGRSQLFDLQTDPEERCDRAGEFPERVAGYREHLTRWAKNQKRLVTAVFLVR